MGSRSFISLEAASDAANYKSYCILINDSETEVAAQRAEIMVSTADGFVIAEKDLEIRGPGEFFGTRQHGVPDLKIANLGQAYRYARNC